MKEKIAYLVLGTESSATRFVTKCIISAGADGESGHHQKWDFNPLVGDKIVWRRSYPHKWDDPNNFPFIIKNSIGWPDTDAMYDYLTKQGYKVVVVVTMRDWNAINGSATRIKYRPHTSTIEKCTQNTKESYIRIFSFISKYNLDYVVFNYEAAILNGDAYISKTMEMIGLNKVSGYSMNNENQKYY